MDQAEFLPLEVQLSCRHGYLAAAIDVTLLLRAHWLNLLLGCREVLKGLLMLLGEVLLLLGGVLLPVNSFAITKYAAWIGLLQL